MGTFDNLKNKVNEITVNTNNKKYNKKYQKERITIIYDGILFESNSKEGLNDLIAYYEKAKRDIVDESFFDQVRKTGVMITNYQQTCEYIDGEYIYKDEMYTAYYYELNLVYIEPNFIKLGTTGVLLHELGHCLDYNNGKYSKGYEVCKKATADFVPSAFDSNTNFEWDMTFNAEFKKYFNYFQDMYLEYINDIIQAPENQQMIEQMAQEEFTKEFNSSNYSSEAYKKFRKQKQQCYIDDLIIKSGAHSIADIYDALTGGNLTNCLSMKGNSIGYTQNQYGYVLKGINTKYKGHSKDYYSDEINRSEEIIAQLSLLINLGKTNLLYSFFPKKVADQLIEGYKAIIDYNNTYVYEDEQQKNI